MLSYVVYGEMCYDITLVLKVRLKLSCYAPSFNHIGKADFLYFEVEDPNGIDLIMLWDSSMIFSAKVTKN